MNMKQAQSMKNTGLIIKIHKYTCSHPPKETIVVEIAVKIAGVNRSIE